MLDDFSRIQNIVSQQLGIDPHRVKPNADFGKELGADSLDIVELVMIIDQHKILELKMVINTKDDVLWVRTNLKNT